MLVSFRNRPPDPASRPTPPPHPSAEAVAKFLRLAKRRPVTAFVVEGLIDRLLADLEAEDDGTEAER